MTTTISTSSPTRPRHGRRLVAATLLASAATFATVLLNPADAVAVPKPPAPPKGCTLNLVNNDDSVTPVDIKRGTTYKSPRSGTTYYCDLHGNLQF